jgi:hypothetical protein
MFDRGIRTNDASPSASSSSWGARRLQTEVLISIFTRDDGEKIRAGVTSEKPIYFDSDYRSGRWIYLTQSLWTNEFKARARAMREGLEPELSVAMMQPPGQPVRP